MKFKTGDRLIGKSDRQRNGKVIDTGVDHNEYEYYAIIWDGYTSSSNHWLEHIDDVYTSPRLDRDKILTDLLQ